MISINRQAPMDYHYLRHLAKTGGGYIHPHGKAATEILIESLALGENQRILEIGCGTGATLVQIALRYNVQIDGIDLLPEMLKVVRRRVSLTGVSQNVRLHLVESGSPLPFENKSFDRVFAESVLGFQGAVSAALLIKEVYRVLKEGGLFVVNDAIWKAPTSSEIVTFINQSCLTDFGLRQASEQPWKLEDWLALMEDTGFTVISYDLLENYFSNGSLKNSKIISNKEMISNLLTRFYRLKAYWQPSLFAQWLRYRKLLIEHRNDGKFVESRLFVLKKLSNE
mgnify:CR=1 FL=1